MRHQTKWCRLYNGERGQFFVCYGDEKSSVQVSVVLGVGGKRWIVVIDGMVSKSEVKMRDAKRVARQLATERSL